MPRKLYTYNFKMTAHCPYCLTGGKLVADMKNDRERSFAGCNMCRRFVTTTPVDPNDQATVDEIGEKLQLTPENIAEINKLYPHENV